MILSFWFVLFAGSLWAQQSANKTEKAAIQRAKNVLVSSLDSSLPKVSLEFFLNYEAGGAPIQWEVNDCGEQTGKRLRDRGASALCVEADFAKDQTDVAVMVSVGTLKKGPSGVPVLVRVTVNGPGGRSRSPRLGELPKELHRPAPKSPRDFPAPIIASSG
jgi:hypothetical protein